MTDTALADEKLRAEAMSRTTGPIDYFYWSGYQMGLAGPHPDEKAILSMIGSDTPMRDGEGRGYRDGRTWAGKRR